MSTNERKYLGPLVVESKLSDAERMKLESNYLRGTIVEDLNDSLTSCFKGDNFLLIRFYVMYQQNGRDIRAERTKQKLETHHAMLLRCHLLSWVITTTQWQEIDKFATDNTMYGSIRLTNRQTFQFHGILKKHVKPVNHMLLFVGLDALTPTNGRRKSLNICYPVLAPMRRFDSIRKSRDHRRRTDPRPDLSAA